MTSAVTGLTIYVDHTFTGQIGTITGATRTPLDVPTATLIIGRDPTGNGSGAPFIYITSSAGTLTATVIQTAQTGAIAGVAPVVLEANALILNHNDGNVAVAPLSGTTTTATSIGIAVGTSTAQPSLLIGLGTTVTALTMSGGVATSFSGNTTATTVISNAGIYNVNGAGAHTTMTIGANSVVNYRNAGTITTLNNEGTFDRTGDVRALTITTSNAYGGASFLYDNGKAGSTIRTTSNLVNCGMQNITSSTPIGERY